MLSKTLICSAAILCVFVFSVRAQSLVLCDIHGDAWIEGGATGSQLLEFKIISTDGAILPANYVSMKDRGFSINPPLSATTSLLWDKSSGSSFPSAGYYNLGFTYNRGMSSNPTHWSFYYNTGQGLKQGTILNYIPEPATLMAFALAGLLALRRRAC